MDPGELIVPVFGIAAAAALTFYSVSFMQMSDKSFEDVDGAKQDSPTLLSSLSNKERRDAKSKDKQRQ